MSKLYKIASLGKDEQHNTAFRKEGSALVLHHTFPAQGYSMGACGNGHVGKHGDVCTSVGCNGTPFR